ncbi:hypothetical protein [Cognatilysobacter terrigena]|uniref:hypothetical protein n=1 Tax=Cognatilysobacter terrigena TaxID=2488749 RepID=UPI00105B8C74|nr:hypothetical protein [Lysobacter terrigena]
MTWHNRIATFVWGMAAAWNGMLMVMTGVLLRDGVRSPWTIAAVMALFWVAGVAFAVFASRQACTRTTLFHDGGLHVRQRFPLRVAEQRFDARDRPQASVVEGSDSDGDAYFSCELPLGPPFRMPYRVVEGRRERCEDACASLNTARR